MVSLRLLAEVAAVGNPLLTGTRFTNIGGVLQQDLRDSAPPSASRTRVANHAEDIIASLFDDSVHQLDVFGRIEDSGDGAENLMRYLSWEERSTNSTLTCKDPGCTAHSSLKAPFDPKTEMAKNCKLTVAFHPTDFDDQYSGEQVEWVQVNSKQVSSNCRPMHHGCNATASRPLLPCVQDVPVDMLMKDSGAVTVSAKINALVDECPYKGNLLSGVPMLTCLVTAKEAPKKSPQPEKLATSRQCHFKVPLQCPTRGCEAEIAIPIDDYCATVVGNCKISVLVNQTDYDNKDGSSDEAIEYIKVAGKEVISNKKPGENPCKSAFGGKPIPDSKLLYKAFTDHPFTHEDIKNSSLLVQGKISRHVDECASNGYLFDAMAEVTCTPKASGSFAQEEAANAHRRKLRGLGS